MAVITMMAITNIAPTIMSQPASPLFVREPIPSSVLETELRFFVDQFMS
jgi:hypothetical protein